MGIRPSASETLKIVRAEPHDTPLILQFVRKLAEFERLSDQVIVNEDTLREGLFGAGSAAEAILAYFGSAPAAFAVYFHTFSTFSGYTGIYLEDLFVEPNYRGRGVGKSILVYLAKLAKQRGRGRLSWAVLDWNEPAIRFYRNLGAVPLGDWTVFELTGPALDRLAQAEVGIA